MDEYMVDGENVRVFSLDTRFVVKFKDDSVIDVHVYDLVADKFEVPVDFDIMRSMCPNFKDFLKDALHYEWLDVGLSYIEYANR